jgi:hypothetical protein
VRRVLKGRKQSSVKFFFTELSCKAFRRILDNLGKTSGPGLPPHQSLDKRLGVKPGDHAKLFRHFLRRRGFLPDLFRSELTDIIHLRATHVS